MFDLMRQQVGFPRPRQADQHQTVDVTRAGGVAGPLFWVGGRQKALDMLLHVRERQITWRKVFAAQQPVQGVLGIIGRAVGDGPGRGLVFAQEKVDAPRRQQILEPIAGRRVLGAVMRAEIINVAMLLHGLLDADPNPVMAVVEKQRFLLIDRIQQRIQRLGPVAGHGEYG